MSVGLFFGCEKMVDMNYIDDTLIAKLYGEIDHHIAPSIRNKIDSECETYRPRVLVLDFEGVTFMDSSGIGLIMGRYREISLLGGRLEVTNIPPYLERIVALSGIGNLGVLK